MRRLTLFALDKSLCRFATKRPKQCWSYEKLHQRRSQQTADDHRRYRIQNLPTQHDLRKYGIESVVCQDVMTRHLFCQRRQYFVQCFIKCNNSVSFDDSVSNHQAIDEIEFCLAEIMQCRFDNLLVRHTYIFMLQNPRDRVNDFDAVKSVNFEQDKRNFCNNFHRNQTFAAFHPFFNEIGGFHIVLQHAA